MAACWAGDAEDEWRRVGQALALVGDDETNGMWWTLRWRGLAQPLCALELGEARRLTTQRESSTRAVALGPRG